MSLDPAFKFIVYSPCATASVSLVGSSCMLLTLHRTRLQSSLNRSGLNARASALPTSRTYDRLIAGIAVSDILMSLALVVGPLPVPKETQFPGARGTQATCSAQAVILQLGAASIPYSFMLMFYYLLVIRYNVKEKTISTRIEPFLHFIPIAYHVTTAILGLVWEVMNFAGSLCWIAASPLGCVDFAELECERGGEYEFLFGNYLLVVPTMIWAGLLVAMLAALSFTVWQKQRQMDRFVFRGSQRSENAARNTRQVMVQCLLYAVSFTNYIVWNTIGNIFSYVGRDIELWTVCVAAFFFPLQGLFNFLIFIRPRYMRKRSLHPSKGRWFALQQADWNPIFWSSATSEAGRSNERTRPETLKSSNVQNGIDAELLKEAARPTVDAEQAQEKDRRANTGEAMPARLED